MLLFRSEEHLGKWLDERDIARGASMTLEQQWRLADAWYSNRLDPGWKRRSPSQGEAVFRSCGLEGEFWNLT